MNGRHLPMIFLLLTINTAYGETSVHSYLSLTASYSDSGQLYRKHIDQEGSFEDSRVLVKIQHLTENSWKISGLVNALGENDFSVEVQQAAAEWEKGHIKFRVGRLPYPIGLWSEQFRLGFDLLWIRAPESFYNLHPFGPNVVHEDLTGLALQVKTLNEGVQVEAFFGHSELANGRLKQVAGLKLQLQLHDRLIAQLATHGGFAAIDSNGGLQINDESKTSFNAGLQTKIGKAFFVGEWALTSFGPSPLDTDVYYLSAAYAFGNWQPYVLAEHWRTDAGWGEDAALFGIKKKIDANLVMKLEWKQIEPQPAPRPDGIGVGLFEASPANNQAQLFSIALDFQF